MDQHGVDDEDLTPAEIRLQTEARGFLCNGSGSIAGGDPEPILREGQEDIERIKRDTTAGMGVGPVRSRTG